MEYELFQAVGANVTAATAEAIDFRNLKEASVIVDNDSSITSITVWASDTETGTYYAVYSAAGAAATVTITKNRCYQLPTSIASCHWIKLVSDAADDVIVMAKPGTV